jgi:hypothetical protein
LWLKNKRQPWQLMHCRCRVEKFSNFLNGGITADAQSRSSSWQLMRPEKQLRHRHGNSKLLRRLLLLLLTLLLLVLRHKVVMR